jgi:hypothetical protein
MGHGTRGALLACHCTAQLSAHISIRGGEKIDKKCGKEEEEENFLDKTNEALKGRF